MPNQIDLPITTLHQLLRLDAATGKLYWLKRSPELFGACETRGGPSAAADRWNSKYAGKEAAGVGPKGYTRISIFGRRYRAHRVAFAMHYGRWPTGEVDHVDRDRSNNRPKNLREASSHQNSGNSGARMTVNNSSIYKGVTWARHANKWRAQGGNASNAPTHLGYFENEIDAAKAYDEFALREYGEYAHLNFLG